MAVTESFCVCGSVPPPQRGRKPLSLLSGTFSAVAADLVSHRISSRPSANKVNARPKGNWCLQLEDKSEVKDGAAPGGGGNWEESQRKRSHREDAFDVFNIWRKGRAKSEQTGLIPAPCAKK